MVHDLSPAKWGGMFKIILHSGLIGLLGYLFIGLFLSPASGQTMSNKDYKIKMEGFNTISDTATSADQSAQSTVGARGTAVSEGVNFKVRTGFENIASSLPFSVSLSSDLVDFGLLTPTNPIVRTVTLGVYSLSLYGYSVITAENHPLSAPEASGTNIPDATCDNGECSQEKAGAWINTLTYGFGYRCDNIIGDHCDSSFSKTNLYKHFADISNGQSSQSIMAGIGSNNKETRISYKVNISGNQKARAYTNIITFIAVPNF